VVVGTTLAAIVAVGTVAARDVLAGSGGVPASAAVSLPAQARARVVAQPGDTLWSIASAHHGEVSITRYLDTLVDLNGGPTIQVGQELVLP
jgi:LysM repeat protein